MGMTRARGDAIFRAGLRTGGGGEGVGSTKHDAAGLDGVEALPDHGDDGAGGHVLNEAREEGLALEVGVVCARGDDVSPGSLVERDEKKNTKRTLLEVLGRGVDELERDELEAALLEAVDDVADEPALDAVGLRSSRSGR